MKKITLFFLSATLLASINVIADTNITANKYAEGEGILHYVMYDCGANQIVQTLPEVDQTFTFAIDISGTPGLEEFINNYTLTSAGEKSIAMHMWAGDGSYNCDVRLMHMTGTLYGATLNLEYLVGNDQANPVFPSTFLTDFKTTGTIFYWHAIVLGFGYSEDDEGIDWWNPSAHGTSGFGVLHVATAPYTGAYDSDSIFYGDDNEINPYIFYEGASAGLAAPCSVSTAVKEIPMNASPIIKHEYYNLQGGRLIEEPQNGLFIDKAVRVDGSNLTNKKLKFFK